MVWREPFRIKLRSRVSAPTLDIRLKAALDAGLVTLGDSVRMIVREANNRAGVDAGCAFLFAFGRPRPGTTQHGR
jgi:hypothetical protein